MEEETRARALKLIKPREWSSSRSTTINDLPNGNERSYNLKILEQVADNVENDRLAYCLLASAVRSVIPFAKVAYPDLVGGDAMEKLEPLNNKDRKVCRSKLLTCVDRGLHPGSLMHENVYDLDALASSSCYLVDRRSDEDHTMDAATVGSNLENRRLFNLDERRVGQRANDVKQLQFESRFESGNLRKAIQVNVLPLSIRVKSENMANEHVTDYSLSAWSQVVLLLAHHLACVNRGFKGVVRLIRAKKSIFSIIFFKDTYNIYLFV